MQVVNDIPDFSDLATGYVHRRKAGRRERIILIAGGAFTLLGIPSEISQNDFAQSWPGLVIIAVMTLLAAGVSYLFRPVRRDYSVLAAFAARNGWSFAPDTVAVQATEAGCMFQSSYTMSAQYTVQGTLHGLPYQLFEYVYIPYKDKVVLTVMEFTLPQTVPSMIIQPQSTNGDIVYLPTNTLNEHQRIQLEGNFDHYFTVYAPENYTVAALEILSPNAMEALIAYAA